MAEVELERLLAHGRGAGWLAARERGSAAIEHVLRCVIEDPRVDTQVESRADYYASLLIALDADCQPIVEAIVGCDSDGTGLMRAVLIQMAWRGNASALAAVVERVRSGAETDEDLLEIGDVPFAEQVYLLARRTIRPPEPSPPVSRPAHDLEPDLGIHELLAIARKVGDPRSWRAGQRLGELGYGELLAEAEAHLRSQCGVPIGQRTPSANHHRLVSLRYLSALPAALTLARARHWFHTEWPLALAGEEILIRHAEPEDRSMLEQAGAKALAERHMYRLCSIVEALDRIAAPESLEFLIDVYCTVEYSYARKRACTALLAHAEHPRVQPLLIESLWDCEDWTREDACTGVDPQAAGPRLRELVADRFEQASVREAAREALADEDACMHAETRRGVPLDPNYPVRGG